MTSMHKVRRRLWPTLPVMALVLFLAAILGAQATVPILGLLVTMVGAVVLLQRPVLGILALMFAAVGLKLSFGTGTEVVLNPATLLVPTLSVLWFVDMVLKRNLRVVPSRTNRPLALFLVAGLLSLLIGNALWDPNVPRPGNFTLVQLAQWAVFAFSAGALWLTGNLVRDKVWLRRLTLPFLALAGSLSILWVLPQVGVLVYTSIATGALEAAPFWMLLTALAGGQLLFNQELGAEWRWFLLAVLGAVLYYAFYLERATVSNWVGVVAVGAVLAWLRFPRLRWPVVILLVMLTVSGLLTSSIYEFAGGEAEWIESGGSRLALISRVIKATARNPITGLGPAAYRVYAQMQPLFYEGALYLIPMVSSHNNYVDLFSHMGLLGLGLFFWFAAEIFRLGIAVRARFINGFAAGYVNGVLAAWAGALVLMLFADWILPFVYNIGFSGFQASVLVWLFLGGLVALDQTAVRHRV